jgi:hypothetical protein
LQQEQEGSHLLIDTGWLSLGWYVGTMLKQQLHIVRWALDSTAPFSCRWICISCKTSVSWGRILLPLLFDHRKVMFWVMVVALFC